jgi:hypothetical protein
MDTHRQSTIAKVVSAVALIVVVAGCTTLPEPASVDDTLLVVDVRRQPEPSSTATSSVSESPATSSATEKLDVVYRN